MTKAKIISKTIFSIVCVLCIVALCLMTDDWLNWLRGIGTACWFYTLICQIKCLIEI